MWRNTWPWRNKILYWRNMSSISQFINNLYCCIVVMLYCCIVVMRCIFCFILEPKSPSFNCSYSILFIFIRCTTLVIRYHSLSFVITLCHSLSFAVSRCTTRLSFYKRSFISLVELKTFLYLIIYLFLFLTYLFL